MPDELKPGPYWVKWGGKDWKLATVDQYGYWTIPPCEYEVLTRNLVEIGEPIPSHAEQRELRIKASNWDVHEAECRKVGLTIEEAARILYGEAHP